MRALILGASGGIGRALVSALRGRGEVIGLSRSDHGLEVTDEGSVAAALGRLEPGFDLVRQEAQGRTIRYTTRPYATEKPSGERYGS